MSHVAFNKPLPWSADPWAWRRQRSRCEQPPAKARGDWRPRLALLAAISLTIGGGAYAAHAQSARIAPWVNPILRGVGYPWGVAALKVTAVSSRLVAEGRAQALVVEGEVVNAGAREIDAPILRLAVRSADEAEIFVWTTHPAKTHLAPGERSRFSSRLEAPPSAGVDVAVALGKKGD